MSGYGGRNLDRTVGEFDQMVEREVGHVLRKAIGRSPPMSGAIVASTGHGKGQAWSMA